MVSFHYHESGLIFGEWNCVEMVWLCFKFGEVGFYIANLSFPLGLGGVGGVGGVGRCMCLVTYTALLSDLHRPTSLVTTPP